MAAAAAAASIRIGLQAQVLAAEERSLQIQLEDSSTIAKLPEFLVRHSPASSSVFPNKACIDSH